MPQKQITIWGIFYRYIYIEIAYKKMSPIKNRTHCIQNTVLI